MVRDNVDFGFIRLKRSKGDVQENTALVPSVKYSIYEKKVCLDCTK